MNPGPLHPQSTYSRQSVRYEYLKIHPHVFRYKCYILVLLPYLFFISNLICFLLKNREYLIYYHQGRTFIRPLDYTIDSIKIHLLSLQHCFFFLLFRNLLSFTISALDFFLNDSLANCPVFYYFLLQATSVLLFGVFLPLLALNMSTAGLLCLHLLLSS